MKLDVSDNELGKNAFGNLINKNPCYLDPCEPQ